MNKNSRNIRESFNKLNENEKRTLILCTTVLCTTEGVTLRNLFSVIGTDPQVFQNEMNTIFKLDLLNNLTNVVYMPDEVIQFLQDIPLPTEALNSIMSRLVAKTTMSLHDDLLQSRDFFQMGARLLYYVLEHGKTDDIFDYALYAKLANNLARHYDVYGKIEPSIQSIDDLCIMRSLRKAQEHTKRDLAFSALNTSIARLYISGFHYKQAKPLLDEAIEIERQCLGNATSETYLTYAFYYENFGIAPKCLEYLYKTFETSEDKAQKMLAAILIAYQFTLHGETTYSDAWLEKVDINSIPEHHEIRLLSNLIALFKQKDTLLAETLFNKTEQTLKNINPDAAMLDRVYYIYAQKLEDWGLSMESNNLYRKYIHLVQRHFKATNGGLLILNAAECVRLTNIGAMSTARSIVNNELASPNLFYDYATSVRLEVCLAKVLYYRANNDYLLVDKYCNIGLNIASQVAPSEETLNILHDAFGERLPAWIKGDDLLWLFEHQRLLGLMDNQKGRLSDVGVEIKRLLSRFPEHKSELEVIFASLHDNAVHAWHNLLILSDEEDKFEVSLQCARAAIQRGFIREGACLFDIVQQTAGFRNLNQYKMISLLIEIVINLEKCSEYRSKTENLWNHIEQLAKNTPLQADVLQAHANCAFENADYKDAIMLYNKALEQYIPEQNVFDERLCSMYSYLSSCLAATSDYESAVISIQAAKQNYPSYECDNFNLNFNHCYFLLGARKYKQARKLLSKVKALAHDKEEQECVADLCEIFHLNSMEREAYFRQTLYNGDINIE